MNQAANFAVQDVEVRLVIEELQDGSLRFMKKEDEAQVIAEDALVFLRTINSEDHAENPLTYQEAFNRANSFINEAYKWSKGDDENMYRVIPIIYDEIEMDGPLLLSFMYGVRTILSHLTGDYVPLENTVAKKRFKEADLACFLDRLVRGSPIKESGDKKAANKLFADMKRLLADMKRSVGGRSIIFSDKKLYAELKSRGVEYFSEYAISPSFFTLGVAAGFRAVGFSINIHGETK